MNKIVYPNYNNCILNLINSILKYYKVSSDYNGLKCLESTFTNKFKNMEALT